jgi:superfamily I DNA/RNA helicase
MHSAKGLEFDVVYVVHAADGRTRFITPAVLQHFAQVQARPDAPADEAPRARSTSASIRKGVQALWD